MLWLAGWAGRWGGWLGQAGYLLSAWLAACLAGGRTWHWLQQLQHAQAVQADVVHTAHLPQREHIACGRQAGTQAGRQGGMCQAGRSGGAWDRRCSSSSSGTVAAVLLWPSRASSGTSAAGRGIAAVAAAAPTRHHHRPLHLNVIDNEPGVV